MEIIVTGCNNCPFSQFQEFDSSTGYFCKLAKFLEIKSDQKPVIDEGFIERTVIKTIPHDCPTGKKDLFKMLIE